MYKYTQIIKALDYINHGHARDISVLWVSPYAARIVNDDCHVKSIRVDFPMLLDNAVTTYLEQYAEVLAKIRFSQFFKGGRCSQ